MVEEYRWQLLCLRKYAEIVHKLLVQPWSVSIFMT
jgi:hypothetical protein